MDTLHEKKKTIIVSNPEPDERLKERTNEQETEKLINAYVSMWWIAAGIVILFVVATVIVMLCVRSNH